MVGLKGCFGEQFGRMDHVMITLDCEINFIECKLYLDSKFI